MKKQIEIAKFKLLRLRTSASATERKHYYVDEIQFTSLICHNKHYRDIISCDKDLFVELDLHQTQKLFKSTGDLMKPHRKYKKKCEEENIQTIN